MPSAVRWRADSGEDYVRHVADREQPISASGRGWVRPIRVSHAEHDARRVSMREATAADEERRALAHAAIFGDVQDRTVIEEILPVSGWHLRWRADGYFQILRADDPEDDTDWIPWTHPSESGVTGSGEVPPGDTNAPTWWVWWSTCLPEDEITGWLADDHDLTIVRVGRIWAAEYRSTPQPLFLNRNGELMTLPPLRPSYLLPAAYPFNRTAPNPRPA